jgi:hypothetical protein
MGAPFAHVARLAADRPLAACISVDVVCVTGAGRTGSGSTTGAGLSDRTTKDRRNQEGLVDNAGDSLPSLAAGRMFFSDILRPISLAVDDFGLNNGSTASVKYSWFKA